MEKDNGTDIVVVYSGKLDDSKKVNELLHDNKIAAAVKNDSVDKNSPWYLSKHNKNSAEVQIYSKDKEKAINIIEEYLEV
jgi:hypothetical protein